MTLGKKQHIDLVDMERLHTELMRLLQKLIWSAKIGGLGNFNN